MAGMGELCAFACRALPFLVILVGKYCFYFSCISAGACMHLQAIVIVWTYTYTRSDLNVEISAIHVARYLWESNIIL